jgi:hypothetical protein
MLLQYGQDWVCRPPRYQLAIQQTWIVVARKIPQTQNGDHPIGFAFCQKIIQIRNRIGRAVLISIILIPCNADGIGSCMLQFSEFIASWKTPIIQQRKINTPQNNFLSTSIVQMSSAYKRHYRKLRLPAVHSKVVQSAGDLHHQIVILFFRIAEQVFDNATAFNPSNNMLYDNPNT